MSQKQEQEYKKVIVFFNTKGGTGKSTLSYLLYKHFKVDYFIVNTDFIKAIDDNEILHFTNLEDKEKQKEFIKNLKMKDAIIDTRGSLLNDDTIKFFITKSNLIVVPTAADILNLRQTFVVLKDLQIFKKNILLVFNKFEKEQKEIIDEFLDFLQQKNIKIADYLTIKSYKSFVKCVKNKDMLLKSNNKFLDHIYKKPFKAIESLHNKIQNLIK